MVQLRNRTALILAIVLTLAVCPQRSEAQQVSEDVQSPRQSPPASVIYTSSASNTNRTAPTVEINQNRCVGPTYTRDGYVSIQVNIGSGCDNIPGDAANEPSIAVSPTNPGQIVVGWREFGHAGPDYHQAGWAYSTNHGATWTFGGVVEAGVPRTDPVLGVSPDGVFYYYSAKDDDTCDLFRSFDGGVTWGPPIAAFGGKSGWMTVDHTNGPGRGNIYTSWGPFDACCGMNDLFSRSTDGGSSFIPPVPVLGAPGSFLFPDGQIAVGLDSVVYVAGPALGVTGTVQLHSSSNGFDPLQSPIFDTLLLPELGGAISSGQANQVGSLGRTNISVDHSDGPTRGNIYLLGSVNPDNPDVLDVMFTRSTDGGLNWDPPVRIHDDIDNAQEWFGTMSVSTNGRIDVVYYESQFSMSETMIVLIYTSSLDGGLTWEPTIPVSLPFDRTLGIPDGAGFGDYIHMVSDDLGADVVYSATFNGEQDIYYLRVGAPDCNFNGVADHDEIAMGTSSDCNANDIPDECELLKNDCNTDGVPDDCQRAELRNSLVEPVDVAACPLDVVSFQVTSPLDGLSYRWLKDGLLLIEGAPATGTTTNTLVIPVAGQDDVGLYSCIVRRGCFSVLTEAAELTFNEPVSIEQHPQSLLTTCQGNTVLMTVTAAGDGLTYSWERDGVPLPLEPGKYQDVDTPVLRILDAGPADFGEYTCVVSDNCSNQETSTPGQFQFGDASYISQPSPQCVALGDTVTYTATADSGAFTPLTRWRKDGVPLSNGGDISGAFTSTLVIQNASPADNGTYQQSVIALGPNCAAFSDAVELQLNSCHCDTPGDMDADGDLDLADLHLFTLCFEANVAVATECACANVDDFDDAVDVEDWNSYAPILTGP